MGAIIGLLLFAVFYGFVYFGIYSRYGEVAPGAGIMGVVFAIAFAMIGGGLEYHWRNPRK